MKRSRGARLTTNMGRIGGFERDFSPTAIKKIREFLDQPPKVLKEFEKLLMRNRIFMDRTIEVGPIIGRTSIELWIYRSQPAGCRG